MRFLLLDANVLIDFYDADPTVFAIVASSVGEVQVASPVLAEVKQLSEVETQRIGVKVIDPPIEMLSKVAQRGGALAFADRLCLELARAEGWTCVTNDRPLRRECEAVGVPILWGLELIALTVEAGGLPASDAAELGRTIADANRYITEDVLERFLSRIGQRKRGRGRK